jgi:hypothetical protein
MLITRAVFTTVLNREVTQVFSVEGHSLASVHIELSITHNISSARLSVITSSKIVITDFFIQKLYSSVSTHWNIFPDVRYLFWKWSETSWLLVKLKELYVLFPSCKAVSPYVDMLFWSVTCVCVIWSKTVKLLLISWITGKKNSRGTWGTMKQKSILHKTSNTFRNNVTVEHLHIYNE